MAKLFTAKLDYSSLKSAITQVKKEAKDSMNSLLQESANRIAARAKGLNTIPSISATIKVNKVSGRFEVSMGQGLSDPEIAAYHEFGTGDFARALVGTLPEDWKIYAMTFYKNGLGRLPASPSLYPAMTEEIIRLQNIKYL